MLTNHYLYVLSPLCMVLHLGVNRLGMSRLGMSRLGVSKLAMSRLGMSKLGMSRLGISRLGVSRLGMSRLGMSGLATGGFDKDGLAMSGLSRVSRLAKLRVDVISRNGMGGSRNSAFLKCGSSNLNRGGGKSRLEQGHAHQERKDHGRGDELHGCSGGDGGKNGCCRRCMEEWGWVSRSSE
ncbi:hypothetical protein BC939DRAFT_516002, partial [Gamsiella multidivaricata]|uniref:uncharacterized protein n=1 Tax=Gamsiella multidivaricata TaxID=101098 RepID=UPI00221FE229